MSIWNRRGFGATWLCLTAMLLALTGCRSVEKLEMKLETDVRRTPPVTSSLEVSGADGKVRQNGGQVDVGETVTVTLRGTPGVQAVIEGFGRRVTANDEGGGVYRAQLLVSGPEGRDAKIGAHLYDPAAQPSDGNLQVLSLRVPTRVVEQPPSILDPIRAEIGDSVIYFAGQSAKLGDDSLKTLERWRGIIGRSPGKGVDFVLIGHCDYRGAEDFNHTLGLARATEVRKRLIALGVDASRVGLTSRGEEQAGDCATVGKDRRESCMAGDRKVTLAPVAARGS